MKLRFRLPGYFRAGPAYCWRCGKLAVWHYSPSYKGKREWREMYCDRCVPRGCSCEMDGRYGLPNRDKRGRRLPCCEFMFRANGYTLSRPGKMAWRANVGSGRFYANPPHRGNALRWPIAWYFGPARAWVPHGLHPNP